MHTLQSNLNKCIRILYDWSSSFLYWFNFQDQTRKPIKNLKCVLKQKFQNKTSLYSDSHKQLFIKASWKLIYSKFNVDVYVMRSSKMSLKSVKIQFTFFCLIACITCKAAFYNRPNWNWSSGSTDTASCRVTKNKEK